LACSGCRVFLSLGSAHSLAVRTLRGKRNSMARYPAATPCRFDARDLTQQVMASAGVSQLNDKAQVSPCTDLADRCDLSQEFGSRVQANVFQPRRIACLPTARTVPAQRTAAHSST